jgi:hypothetical protein
MCQLFGHLTTLRGRHQITVQAWWVIWYRDHLIESTPSGCELISEGLKCNGIRDPQPSRTNGSVEDIMSLHVMGKQKSRSWLSLTGIGLVSLSPAFASLEVVIINTPPTANRVDVLADGPSIQVPVRGSAQIPGVSQGEAATIPVRVNLPVTNATRLRAIAYHFTTESPVFLPVSAARATALTGHESQATIDLSDHQLSMTPGKYQDHGNGGVTVAITFSNGADFLSPGDVAFLWASHSLMQNMGGARFRAPISAQGIATFTIPGYFVGSGVQAAYFFMDFATGPYIPVAMTPDLSSGTDITGRSSPSSKLPPKATPAGKSSETTDPSHVVIGNDGRLQRQAGPPIQ